MLKEFDMHAIGKFLAIWFIASFPLVPLASAQNQSPPPSSSPSTTTPGTPPGSTVKPSDVTDKKLDATAAAVKKVSAVSDSYKKKLAATPDNAEKEKLLDQADREVTKAVTDQGLSVEEYLGIMKVAENDAGVRNKLIDRLK
jgi:hypothetical protein